MADNSTARLDDLHKSFDRHLRRRDAQTAPSLSTPRRSGSPPAGEARGRTATLDELSRAAIREWLAQLTDINEPATVKMRYRGLFRFCGWHVDEEELGIHPMRTLSPPQPKSKPVPVLSDAELAALLKVCAGQGLPRTPRRGRDPTAARLRDARLRAVRSHRGRRRPRPGHGDRERQGRQGPPGLLQRTDHPSPGPLPPGPLGPTLVPPRHCSSPSAAHCRRTAHASA